MAFFRKFRTFMQLQKHGCTLHFEHKTIDKTYAFEISPNAFKHVSKMLQGQHDCLFIDDVHHLDFTNRWNRLKRC